MLGPGAAVGDPGEQEAPEHGDHEATGVRRQEGRAVQEGRRPVELTPEHRERHATQSRQALRPITVALGDLALVVIAIFVVLAYFNGWG